MALDERLIQYREILATEINRVIEEAKRERNPSKRRIINEAGQSYIHARERLYDLFPELVPKK